ncbi:MAG: metallophosphoesterase family protein [Deltaproteobacteria bacterium]|nr:metallophosphoesterase family protein [Deltaproteobacteria bacterium]MBW2658831.1 metallophosphoesterase family protein [Deltaproteobacteria bacterium]
MRVAVFADIHSNLEALQSFIDHSATQSVDRYMCLGDVVGYGANPNQCVARLRLLPHGLFVLGNHDAAVLGVPVNMTQEARQAINWTRKRLSDESFYFLREMSDIIRWDDAVFCHSNPYKPRNWDYVSEKASISRSFARSKAKILFIGHTHVPVAITRKNFFCVYIRSPRHQSVVPVAASNRQIFNCGSVGQPRDGDPRGAYLVYDTNKWLVEFYRFEYDYGKAKEKIVTAGLPESLGRRLLSGL